MGKDVTQAIKTFKTTAKELPKPVVRALNRTAEHVKVVAAREVAKNYTIKQSDAKKMMSIRPKASNSNLNVAVHAESRLLTPYHFKYTPTSGITSGTSKKTTVTIKKGNKVTLRHAFVAVVKGTRNVYYRQNKDRSSMVSLRSVSLPQMIASEKVAPVLNQDMAEFYEKQFTHEFEYHAEKAGWK